MNNISYIILYCKKCFIQIIFFCRKGFNRKKTIDVYLKNNKIKKLNLSCGKNQMKTWLNSDVIAGDIYVDITKKLPFGNETFDIILHEAVIEHIEYEEAMFNLNEILRILKYGGYVVIRTVSLNSIIKNFLKDQDCIKFNKYWESKPHGHKFIFSNKLIMECLKEIGFRQLYIYDIFENDGQKIIFAKKLIS